MPAPRYPDFSILMVDDEKPWLKSLTRSLKSQGKFDNLIPCSDSREVMPLLERHDIGLVLLDLTMPHISGEILLRRIKKEHPHVLVVILSGMNQVEAAVRCMQLGAYDYFVKTAEEERLMDGVRRAVELAELQRENQSLRRRFFNDDLEHPQVFAPIITRNPAMHAVFRYLESVTPSRHPILILGESGVGKELIARAVHRLSRSDGSLVTINVAGLDDAMFADTLFGHLKGAFTGADKSRPGLIEAAAGGTLFLDEIGDLSVSSQIKLLRLLQEGEYMPLGADQPRKLSARVLCATHHDLAPRVAGDGFRKDLYFRLQTHQVVIPPLRERKKDLPLLLNHFLDKAARELGRKKPTVPRQLIPFLSSYSFPGNIRELRAMVFDAVSVHKRGVLSMAPFRRRISGLKTVRTPARTKGRNPFTEMDELPTLREADDLLMAAALERAGNNQTIAAGILGISQPSLSKRLKRRQKQRHP